MPTGCLSCPPSFQRWVRKFAIWCQSAAGTFETGANIGQLDGDSGRHYLIPPCKGVRSTGSDPYPQQRHCKPSLKTSLRAVAAWSDIEFLGALGTNYGLAARPPGTDSMRPGSRRRSRRSRSAWHGRRNPLRRRSSLVASGFYLPHRVIHSLAVIEADFRQPRYRSLETDE